MKKFILLAMLALSTLTINAQHHVYVWNSDKTVTVSDQGVDSVTFAIPSDIVKVETGDAANVTGTSMKATCTTTTATSFSGAVEEGICYSATNEEPNICDTKVPFATYVKNGTWDATIDGLTGNTKYYYRSYAIIGSTAVYGVVKQFTTGGAAEYVDLGLSVKWATCNLGAAKPEDYGNYYAWGETEPKDTYTKDNNTYYSAGNWIKYNTKGTKETLESDDDAATAALGSGWRMPTQAECNELINNCDCIYTTQNGVNGYKIVGPNGNSIFMPAGGQKNGSTLSDQGKTIFYWTSNSWNGSYVGNAYDFAGNDTVIQTSNYGRHRGMTIRPVHE